MGIWWTKHGLERWDERTDPGSVSPETAWEESISIRTGEHVLDAHEVRYHPDSEAILLCKNGNVVTVLSHRSERRSEVLWAISDSLGQNPLEAL